MSVLCVYKGLLQEKVFRVDPLRLLKLSEHNCASWSAALSPPPLPLSPPVIHHLLLHVLRPVIWSGLARHHTEGRLEGVTQRKHSRTIRGGVTTKKRKKNGVSSQLLRWFQCFSPDSWQTRGAASDDYFTLDLSVVWSLTCQKMVRIDGSRWHHQMFSVWCHRELKS